MKITLGSGSSYLEPDEGPRDTRFHKRIVRVERIPNTRAGNNVTLECGHGVQTFGNLAHAEGVVFCTKCRDLEEPVNITEAMRAVSEEYDAECLRARENPAFNQLIMECLAEEYAEIHWELPDYVADIARTMGVSSGTVLPDYVYQACVMCFRFGMRVQRKIDRPEALTSAFWRSDKTPV